MQARLMDGAYLCSDMQYMDVIARSLVDVFRSSGIILGPSQGFLLNADLAAYTYMHPTAVAVLLQDAA